MRNVGLTVKDTDNGLGRGLDVKYYRDGKNKFLESLMGDCIQKQGSTGPQMITSDGLQSNGTCVMDDINSSALIKAGTMNVYNISVLRILPNSKGEVSVPLSRFLNNKEIMKYEYLLTDILCRVLEVSKISETIIEL